MQGTQLEYLNQSFWYCVYSSKILNWVQKIWELLNHLSMLVFTSPFKVCGIAPVCHSELYSVEKYHYTFALKLTSQPKLGYFEA